MSTEIRSPYHDLMRRIHPIPALVALLLALAPAPPVGAQEAPEIRAGDVVVRGGLLFDPAAGEVGPNPGILVRNGTFLTVGLDADAPVPDGATLVEVAPGHTVLPGLFDLHAHYAVDLFGEGRVDEYEVNPVVFLANGVTSTFPAGEVDPEGMRRARFEIASGLRPGPRIHGSGPYFGTARPGWDADAMTPDSIRTEVDHWGALGVAGFKAKGIRPEQLAALIERAHRHGLSVTAHLDSGFRGSVNPEEAILLGIDRIEHFLGGAALPDTLPAYASLEALDLDDPATRARIDAVVRLYLRHRVHFDATLTAYGYFADPEPEVFEPWTDERRFLTPYAREVTAERLPRRPIEQFGRIYRVKQGTLRLFHEAGGAELLTVGTDHPSWGEYLSGFGVHRELHAWVRAGIPPAAALRAATLNPAHALGVSDALGSIEPGKLADLVVVGGDPLDDITRTRDVRRVMVAGRLHDPARLLRSVEGRLGPESEADAEWWMGSVRFER